MIQFDEEKQEKQLHEFRLKEAEDLAKILAQRQGVPYLDLSVIPINTDALRLVPEKDARQAEIAPFRITGKRLDIALLSPEKEATKDALSLLQKEGYVLSPHVVSLRSLERAWERYKEISYIHETQAGILDVANDQIAEYVEKFGSIDAIQKAIDAILKGEKKYHTSRLVELFIAAALATDASDIHIEPEENTVDLRLRLDGVLQNIISFEHKTYKLLLSRIKILSGLKLNLKNEAQDGRFSIKLKDVEIEVRTSMIPGAYGESIVLRLLNPATIGIPFEALGIEERLFPLLENEIRKPNGMILNTGPTGSGKTTTLYAILKRVQAPEIKIITIEDPIEYHLPGVTQTQTAEDKGYTFSTGLRSALRQDPDVIMVGEIRDKETASTAIHAALTGHLVLSTLHTNSAAGAIPRLIDLGINPKIISSALNITLAQRLVRCLCNNCKKKEKPTEKELALINPILKALREKIDEKFDTSFVWRAGGCTKCNKTGYKGRIGIFEAILMNEAIEKIMHENPSEREIGKIAHSQNILTMQEDGVLKVLRGVTTLDELERVVALEERK